MAVPAPITIVATSVMLANPAMIAPVMALYTANAALRIGFKAAEYKVQKDVSASLALIAARLYTPDGGGKSVGDSAQSINANMAAISGRLIAEDTLDSGFKSLTEFLNVIRIEIHDLEAGIDELHIHINNLLDSQDNEYAWSRHTPT